MKGLHVKLEADNLAIAEIASAGDRSVTMQIDGQDRWGAEGLLHLSAALKGIAAVLTATAILFFVTMVDAGDWAQWYGPVSVDAWEGDY